MARRSRWPHHRSRRSSTPEASGPPWKDIEIRARQLDQSIQAVFGLACATRLAHADISTRREELLSALDQGWIAADSGQTVTLGAVAARIMEREDLDDDPVAATAYAVEGVFGPADPWLAASRSIDAAYERVPYAADAASFRPLDTDTESAEVQREFDWLRKCLRLLEEADNIHDAIDAGRNASNEV